MNERYGELPLSIKTMVEETPASSSAERYNPWRCGCGNVNPIEANTCLNCSAAREAQK